MELPPRWTHRQRYARLCGGDIQAIPRTVIAHTKPGQLYAVRVATEKAMKNAYVAREPQEMPILCKPSVHVPEHVITMEDTLRFAERVHAGKSQLPLALRLIQNTGVRKRHIVQPIEETLRHPGFEQRNRIYEIESKKRCPQVVEEALANAGIAAHEVDAIIYVSCTGFLMPSLTAWLINTMGFRWDTRQIPIAQLGCAAGGAAINRAHDFCLAHPGSNVLIVACEFCSLCYQPDEDGVGSL